MMSPCGFVLPPLGIRPIEDYKNNDFIKNLKQNMLENKRNSVCEHCYTLEDNKLYTVKEELTILSGIENDSIEEFERVCLDSPIRFVELKFSNLCNFKCRICYPQISSSITAEERKFNKDFTEWTKYNRPSVFDSTQKDFVLEEIKTMSEHLESVAFTGGEPILNWQHWECLDYWIEHGYNPKIIYFTNGSVLTYKDQHLFDKWKHFDDVEFRISLDAAGAQAEYWRPGESFDVILDNIKNIKENMPHVKLGFTLTFAWPIIFRIQELYETLHDIIPSPKMQFSYVNKKQYDVKVVPLEYKIKFKEQFTEFLNSVKFNDHQQLRDGFENVVAYMLSEDWSHLLEESLAEIDKYDKRRNEDFVTAFPEFRELVEKYARK
jgi:sulfatase maturation enzyme AslB (radical SAM superfamily)